MESFWSFQRRVAFAAVALATALSPVAYDRAARQVTARQIYYSAWQVLPGFTFACALGSYILIRIVAQTARDSGLRDIRVAAYEIDPGLHAF